MKRMLLALAVAGAFFTPVQANAACESAEVVAYCRHSDGDSWFAEVYTAGPVFVGVHVAQHAEGQETGIVACAAVAPGCDGLAFTGIVWGEGYCYWLVGSLECPVNPPPVPYLDPPLP